MAGRVALVGARDSSLGTALLADVGLALARARVARLDALVPLAGQLLVAGHPAREALVAADDRLPLLVLPETPFRGLDHARWTSGRRVAVVQHLVVAHVLPLARLVAGRLLGSTRNRWVNHLCSALALQFLEGGPKAGKAVSWVACFIAFVFPTAQRRGTWKGTDMIDVDATLQIAPMLSTIPLFRALLFAPRVIRS